MLRVPGKDEGKHEAVMAEMRAQVELEATILLPIAAIIETGNHIAQCSNGQIRRNCAERLREVVDASLAGAAPWQIAPMIQPADLTQLMHRFPDEAMRGLGMGDLTIVAEFERQCKVSAHRRVYIWSLDGHLSACDRQP